jgi:hypothetical protein
MKKTATVFRLEILTTEFFLLSSIL